MIAYTSTKFLLSAKNITSSFCVLKCNFNSLNKMEGCITTLSGIKRPAASPGHIQSPIKRSNFVGITPQKDFPFINTPTGRPFRVSVEGNIGAGKSTFIQYFSTFQGIETYPEPVQQWRNLKGHNLLQLLYSDMKKWQTTFQSYVQLSRLKIQMTPPKFKTTRVQMYERSLQNNRFCFLEVAHQNGMHNAEYSVLDKWFRWIRDNVDISLDLIVYLRSSPEKVYERTMQRGRPEETGITLEYLTQLHENHERWLMSNNERFNTIPVIVLDADKTLEDIFEQYKLYEDQILGKTANLAQVGPLKDVDKVKRVLDLS